MIILTGSDGFIGKHFQTVCSYDGLIEVNIDNCFNTSTSVFTAPATGIYLWNQVMATGSGGASQSYSSCEYYINGTRIGRSGWSELPAGYQRWTATDYIQLNAGDLVTFGGEWQQTTTFTNQSHLMMYFLDRSPHLLQYYKHLIQVILILQVNDLFVQWFEQLLFRIQ